MLLLSACQPDIPTMNAEETRRVADLTERMTTRCVGRYLIDLPQPFTLNGLWTAEVEGVKIAVRPMDKAVFDGQMKAYKEQLHATHLPLGKLPYLGFISETPQGVVINRVDSSASTTRAGRTLEGWRWDNGFQLKVSIDAVDGTFPELQSDSYWKERGSDVPTKLAQLLEILSRLRGRSETEVPIEQGFCVPHGFIAGRPSATEEAYVSYHLEGTPDVYFHVSANPEALKDEKSLLQRSAQIEQEMQLSGTKTVRKGSAERNGIRFDEWLFKGRTPAGIAGTMFMLTGNESARGLSNPFVALDMLNGFRIPSPEKSLEEAARQKSLERASLSEAEAIGLWDKVAPTLRLRPGAL